MSFAFFYIAVGRWVIVYENNLTHIADFTDIWGGNDN